jgi:hypothetical protein
MEESKATGNEGAADPKPLMLFRLEGGEVVHYKGLPFYIGTNGATLMGSPGNVAVAMHAPVDPE